MSTTQRRVNTSPCLTDSERISVAGGAPGVGGIGGVGGVTRGPYPGPRTAPEHPGDPSPPPTTIRPGGPSNWRPVLIMYRGPFLSHLGDVMSSVSIGRVVRRGACAGAAGALFAA